MHVGVIGEAILSESDRLCIRVGSLVGEKQIYVPASYSRTQLTWLSRSLRSWGRLDCASAARTLHLSGAAELKRFVKSSLGKFDSLLQT